MARSEKLLDRVRNFAERLLHGHGFRERDSVWVRESKGTGGIHGWAAPQVDLRREDVTLDMSVGVRVDAIERTLAQITGARANKYTPPTHVRMLSHLQREATHSVRGQGSTWRITAAEKTPDRILDDFAAAFTTAGLPLIERCSTLDGLATEMSTGRLESPAAYRLPIIHLQRSDPERAREALELATREMAHHGDAQEFREFAIEMMRRLGDAPLDDTPCEKILSVLRPALRAAYPDRAAIILVQLVRSFWWEEHPKSVENEHCAFCGTTAAEAELMGAPLRICDTCVAAAFVLMQDASIPGSLRARVHVSGVTGYEHLTPERSGNDAVKAESLAADAVRALKRSGLDDAERLVPEVERRLLRAVADRPQESVCMVCGPIWQPPRYYYQEDWRACSFCARQIEAAMIVMDGGRAAICDECVGGFWPRVAEDRRLS